MSENVPNPQVTPEKPTPGSGNLQLSESQVKGMWRNTPPWVIEAMKATPLDFGEYESED